jgi:hypothetical protein
MMSRVPFEPINPVHNLRAFVRLLGDTSGERDSVNWYKGAIFSVIGDDAANQHLIGFEGFSVCRTLAQPDGSFRNLQREVLYYTHPRSGEILKTWKNPVTGEEVDVIHVYNDPVNSKFATEFKQKFGEDGEEVSFPFILPWSFMDDTAMTAFDVNHRWRNVLDPAIWKRESASTHVRVSETLSMFMSRADLENTALTSIGYNGVWNRMSPWCPWMLMGQRPGHLFYRGHYRKLMAGVAGLPDAVRKYTEQNFPSYLAAPTTWVEPNMPSFETYARDHKPRQ